MPETVPVLFSEAELWLLRESIQHEMEGQRNWQYPPASLELSDQIAEALYLCLAQGQTEACLLLSRGDCLVIDYRVETTMKDSSGNPIGKQILGKVIVARHYLALGGEPEILTRQSQEPPDRLRT